MGYRTSKCISVCLLVLATSGVAIVSGCNQSNVVTAQRTISSEAALADFDRMWEIINETHFDPNLNGVDWVAVRDELRPQAAQAMNRREIRSVMREALNRLGQSHFGIIPDANDTNDVAVVSHDETDAMSSENYTEIQADHGNPQEDTTIADDSATDGTGSWDTGLDLRIMNGQAVITSVRDQSPAQEAGVQIGWVLTEVRSNELADGLAKLAEALEGPEFDINGRRMILNNHLQGPSGTTIDLTFLNRDNDTVELNIARIPMPGEFVKFGNLPAMSTHLEWNRFTMTSESGVSTEIGVISFNIWMMPIMAPFEKAMYELRDVDGLIIDLRGNPGGIGGLSSAIGRFLMDEKGSLGTMTMRTAKMQFNIEPVIVTTWGEPLDPFAGPIAILTDSGSASTSEVFAGGLQSLGRVEVFGTNTAGMALPASMEKLPSGDVLLHAIADFVTSTGYRLEHDGVVPDHVVPLTREDLIKGIDSPKHAAAQWIEKTVAE